MMTSKYYFLITITFLILGCSAEQVNSQASDKSIDQTEEQLSEESVVNDKESTERLIGESSVSCITVGELIDLDCLGDDYNYTEHFETEEKQRYYSVATSGIEVLQVFPAMDPRVKEYTRIVGKIVTKSNHFEDDNKIGVGSTMKELLAKNPDAYLYYDLKSNQIMVSNQGSGPQYIIDQKALRTTDDINIGRIDKSKVSPSAKITEIRITRSNYENQDAMANKGAEENEIVESYLNTLIGKYYLKEYSENYYKIYRQHGEFYISNCHEDECEDRGKIADCRKTNGFIPLSIEGIEGEMVPSWTIEQTEEGEVKLYVHDYDAINDAWVDKVYFKGMNED